jgi:aspartyl-tRNA(Asn)/glutamyl-tRNA(Gln) amidotransferase subunit A
MNLKTLTITQARKILDKGEITALELTKKYLKVIEEKDSTIKACLLVDKLGAIKQAKEADRRIKNHEKGALLGIPYLAKDILMTKGLKTTAGSKILKDYTAPYNAYVIEKLNEAGAILLGKTNLDEFAHGSSTETSAFFNTHNPYDLSRTPGGSSGGSAAALAADMCLFSLGTDTGGSIRQPASFCNLVGLKPSYGRVSRSGLMAMTSSTDVIGPFTKTISDSALVLKVIAGKDKKDATSLNESVPDYSLALKKPVNKIKLGFVKEFFLGLNKEIKEKIDIKLEILKKQGVKIVPISLKYIKYSVPTYYIITPSEISSNLARFDGLAWGLSDEKIIELKKYYKNSRSMGFGEETKRRIILGTFCLSAGYADKYYKKAQNLRELIKEDFRLAFEKVDIIASPTCPHPAFKLKEQINDPLAMYLEDIYLSGASLAGLPAISIPAGFIKKDNKELPIGMQLIAPKLEEGRIFQVANSIFNL